MYPISLLQSVPSCPPWKYPFNWVPFGLWPTQRWPLPNDHLFPLKIQHAPLWPGYVSQTAQPHMNTLRNVSSSDTLLWAVVLYSVSLPQSGEDSYFAWPHLLAFREGGKTNQKTKTLQKQWKRKEITDCKNKWKRKEKKLISLKMETVNWWP